MRRQEVLVLPSSQVPHPSPGPGGAQDTEDPEGGQGACGESRQQREEAVRGV